MISEIKENPVQVALNLVTTISMDEYKKLCESDDKLRITAYVKRNEQGKSFFTSGDVSHLDVVWIVVKTQEEFEQWQYECIEHHETQQQLKCQKCCELKEL